MDLSTLSQLRWGAGGIGSPGTPSHKAGPPGCTMSGWARAQALTPRGSHPCSTSPSSGELVSPSTAALSNQPQRTTQTMGQSHPCQDQRDITRLQTPCSFPHISPRDRVLSALQANICTRSRSFPPAVTSGSLWGFIGSAWLGAGMMGAPCPHGHAHVL